VKKVRPFRTLDVRVRRQDNWLVPQRVRIDLRLVCSLAAAASLIVLAGCAGVSNGSSNANGNNPNDPTSAQLAVTPSTLNFGNVAVGSNQVLSGTLTASNADVTVSSAAWNGSGYSLSGITFPVTVPAGKSVTYSVTFAPASTGNAPGGLSFVSNASNSPAAQAFSGDGTQASQHTVALSWNPSSSPNVVGYYVYRRSANGQYSKLNLSPQPGTTYTDAQVTSGSTYFYVTTAIDTSNIESTHSNEATAVIPNP